MLKFWFFFSDEFDPTIEDDYIRHVVAADGMNLTLKIRDTAPTAKFRELYAGTLTPQHCLLVKRCSFLILDIMW
jgi:hypothetical protein